MPRNGTILVRIEDRIKNLCDDQVALDHSADEKSDRVPLDPILQSRQELYQSAQAHLGSMQTRKSLRLSKLVERLLVLRVEVEVRDDGSRIKVWLRGIKQIAARVSGLIGVGIHTHGTLTR